MRLILVGPQGAGKGTQAQRLSARTHAQHISTGDLVRAEIHAGTALGRVIQDYNDQGVLVPDTIIVDMVMPWLTRPQSWILDGFPRNRTQAVALDAALRRSAVVLDLVIVLDVPDDDVIERLAGRVQSQATGRIYHVTHNPPPADDPGPFVQRTDDRPDNIRRRLEAYHAETEPLKGYYTRQGLLRQIDARGRIDRVTDTILQVLGNSAPRLGRIHDLDTVPQP